MIHDTRQKFKDHESVKFLQDPDVTAKLSNCKTLSDVDPSEYRAVFYVGGRVSILRSDVGDCQPTAPIFSRVRSAHRSSEGSKKCGARFSGEATPTVRIRPSHFGSTDNRVFIFAVLEGRRVSRWSLPRT